jgi:hypothetical protein
MPSLDRQEYVALLYASLVAMLNLPKYDDPLMMMDQERITNALEQMFLLLVIVVSSGSGSATAKREFWRRGRVCRHARLKNAWSLVQEGIMKLVIGHSLGERMMRATTEEEHLVLIC